MTQPIILLPVDGSASSLRAATFCTAMAKAFQARVVLLNVQPEIEDWQTHGLGKDSAIAHLQERGRHALEEASRVLLGGAVPFEAVVEFGDAPEVIARVATDKGCEHVIMGTRGQSELKSRLMGGVGMKVIHLLQLPVTFVH